MPTPDDEPALREAREFEMATLSRWVSDFHAERAHFKEQVGAK